MNYKVFYRKYRPDCFANIIGQDYTIQMLKNAVINNKISHAYLFTGPRGTGKTSTAKVFAKTINCLNPINGEACGKCESCLSFASSPDIIEIDAASNNGVDDIRELIDNVKIAPTYGKYKIYIIDEVHMMSTSAFNALLLTLEEPPKHVIFIMATTNVESVPITILSRCQRFNFQKISVDNIKKQIEYVCKEEKIKITDDAMSEIAYLSEGGMRDALSLLDQLSNNGEEITIDKILENYGSISSKFVKDILDALANKDFVKVVNDMESLENTSSDYKVFIKKVVSELSHIAVLIKVGTYQGNFTFDEVKSMIFEFNEILNKVNINMNPYLLIELIFLGIGDVRNQSQEDAMKKVTEIFNKKIDDNTTDKKVNVSNNDNEYIDKLKKIRVNNCFCGAKKDVLNDYQIIWQDLIVDNQLPQDIVSLIMDSKIVAASKSNVILSTKLESTSSIINSRIKEIDLLLKSYFKDDVVFISLSESEWLNEKKDYINKTKENYKYVIIDETSLTDFKPKNIENDEESTTNVFNRDKIEIV